MAIQTDGKKLKFNSLVYLTKTISGNAYQTQIMVLFSLEPRLGSLMDMEGSESKI